jgi:CRP/FNR family transcriptional regulator, cyclic AMP receptor protein
MQLRQGDLFWGMNIDFVKEITDLAVHISGKEGDSLFKVGDPANFFFILLKGSVSMERGKGKWHTAKQPGELFGWSALIHRKEFAASAACGTDSELLKIERDPFLKLLESSPQNKAALYEGLAKMIGNQLLEVYITTAC